MDSYISSDKTICLGNKFRKERKTMKIQTYNIVVGNAVCNARCPYCVSRMTPRQGVGLKVPQINRRNFRIGCMFAKDSNVSTILLTGKGEPTLFPGHITFFLEESRRFGFPFVELQTNGILLFQKREKYEKYLRKWHGLGLTLVAISIAHYESKRNREIFQPKGPCMDLVGLIGYLHEMKLSVRLSCVMFTGGVDSVKEVRNLIAFARDNRVEQLTIRPVEMPKRSEDPRVAAWVANHMLDSRRLKAIRRFLEKNGNKLMELVHGAVVYDVKGQNVCLTNALTIDPFSDEVRQLIFFPDGHLRYDWQYPGAILI